MNAKCDTMDDKYCDWFSCVSWFMLLLFSGEVTFRKVNSVGQNQSRADRLGLYPHYVSVQILVSVHYIQSLPTLWVTVFLCPGHRTILKSCQTSLIPWSSFTCCAYQMMVSIRLLSYRHDLLILFYLTFKNFTIFHFWLCWVFIAVSRLSLIVAYGVLIAVTSLVVYGL